MQRVRRFIARPMVEKLLFARAAAMLTAGRMFIHFLPLRVVRAVMGALAWCPLRRRHRSISLREVSWAVAAASRFVPGADTCLYRAFAAEALLVGSGAPAELMFGFGRGDAGEVKGHAWVRSDGVVVTGADELAEYGTVVHVPSTAGDVDAGPRALEGSGRG